MPRGGPAAVVPGSRAPGRRRRRRFAGYCLVGEGLTAEVRRRYK